MGRKQALINMTLLLSLFLAVSMIEGWANSGSDCGSIHKVGAPGDWCWAIQLRSKMSKQAFSTLNPSVNCERSLLPGTKICLGTYPYCQCSYQVAPGDTCWSVRTKHGMSILELRALNPCLVCSNIQQLQWLCLRP